jgi:hypothetical protein
MVTMLAGVHLDVSLSVRARAACEGSMSYHDKNGDRTQRIQI